ncbi:nucleoside monophosphate kinase [Streptomyces sp. NPDC102441]|uniref:nucleoside monophosphate kinase n=1 Tax=Streptomyces sp. NPDC102441 TaxID=3366176 RepID=UPI00380CDE15
MRAGLLVPDGVTIGAVNERPARPDTERGLLLDGFPRNLAQAEALGGILADSKSRLDAVLDLRSLVRSGPVEGKCVDSTPRFPAK